MVWHIFKKDVRLLWPIPLAIVVVQALCALRTMMLGYFDQPPVLERLTGFLPLLVYLGIAIVAVTVVHQEPLSGLREDWLIRPIRRRDLALSKVLFVLLTVNAPIMIVDVVQQLALHFPLSVSIEVAVSRCLVMVFAFSLPALLLGAVTRSLIDAFVFGIALAIGFTFLFAFATSALSPALFGIGSQAGMIWVSVGGAGLVMMIGAAATLAFQYSTRRTLVARAFALATVLAALCTLVCLPKTVAIAIQESLWRPADSSRAKLRFDSGGQWARVEPEKVLSYGDGSRVPAVVAAARAAEKARIDRQMARIRLPLHISGLHPGDILLADRVAVRITAQAGTMLYQGAGVCTRGGTGVGVSCSDNGLEVWASPAERADTPSEQRLNLPIAVYERIKDEPVRVEVMYVLTRFVAQRSQVISATGDLQSLSEMGACATRIDDDGDEVELGCLTNVGVPSCAAAYLEDPLTNRRNPELHLCDPNYGPFHRVGLEDAVVRSRLSIPFRDRSGLVHYPVDSEAIERARIVLTAYDPVDHFRSSVTIPSIRLVEWRLPDGSRGSQATRD
jgi:hypothetical protein